jgi:hypothetical protein
VIPSHQKPDAPVLEEGKKALEAVGLGDKWFLRSCGGHMSIDGGSRAATVPVRLGSRALIT